MPIPTEDDYKHVHKQQHEAIVALVDVVSREQREAASTEYSKLVYETAWKLVKAFKDVEAVYNYRIVDLDEYKAEVERRRQIGLTIDPATAETTFWWADVTDPYHNLDPKHHAGCVGREQFARNPGGDWVSFDDLPEATSKALWQRDGRKLSFPYGLNPGDDVVNYPPSPNSAEIESGG